MLSLLLLAGLGFAVADIYPDQTPFNHTCGLNTSPPLSCTNATNLTLSPSIDSCCTETFGGLVLSTQFWSTYTGLEEAGQLLPRDQWTLHGLWPDYCNGSYTQYCGKQLDPDPDNSIAYGTNSSAIPYDGPNFDTIIESFGALDLVAYMNKVWIAQNQPNYVFWAHEFSKHATCYSTFQPACYGPKYQENEEIPDFLVTAIERYKELPTYAWLKEAGYSPSNSTGYTVSDFETTLTKRYGALPHIGCSGPAYNETEAGTGTQDDGRVFLSEVWYYSHVHGRPQDGEYMPSDTTFLTNCASTKGALQYPLRSDGSERSL